MTDVSQSTEYFLIISAKPELKLGKPLVDGAVVNVNTVVSLPTDKAKVFLSPSAKQPCAST